MPVELMNTRYFLGDLASAEGCHQPLNITGSDPERLLGQLEVMLLIRYTEELIGNMVTSGKIVCPCHLGIGQEAIAVGVSANLRSSDRVFGGHRSHSHFLALGCDVGELMAEVLGKVSGCSRGMGGSMHLYGVEHGFYGSVPIVGGSVPLAIGAALAAKMDQRGDVGVAYFGDGTAEEGVVHESLNLASKFKLPMLFVCENNMFASHMHINLRQPADSVSRYAAAHCVPWEVVDGNDVVAVEKATARLVARSRAGDGPGFLEAVTYRWRGHVGPREDTDVGVNRKGDLASWKKRDPVKRLAEALSASGNLDGTRYAVLQQEIRVRVARAWEAAEAAPYPDISGLLGWVYAE